MTAVVGLDPSLTGTGIARSDGQLLTVKTVAGHDRRLLLIFESVSLAVARVADLVVFEDLPAHAQAAGLTGLAHGVCRLACERAGVPYLLVPPATLKVYATGKGAATKSDMRMALYQRTGLDVRDDNQADAWWLRQLGLDLAGQAEYTLPKTHRRALDKLALPSDGFGE